MVKVSIDIGHMVWVAFVDAITMSIVQYDKENS